MKKYLSIYTLLALACIVLQSCLFSEEEIFDESSANRATADVIKCQEILKDVPNGWKLEYYIGSNYSAGAVTLLMKFDGKQVEMASETGAESYKPGTIITSLYQVKSEQSTMLTFDSYNPLIHMFSGPLGLNMNLGGDYEFIIMSATPDKVILQGKKYKNIRFCYVKSLYFRYTSKIKKFRTKIPDFGTFLYGIRCFGAFYTKLTCYLFSFSFSSGWKSAKVERFVSFPNIQV